MLNLKIKRLSKNAIIPSKKDPVAAGLDIYTNENYLLKPGEIHAFTTGIAVEIPEGYVGLFWDRSGLGSKGIHRFAGVIDANYRGEWKIILYNASTSNYQVRTGDRIAQCLIQSFEAVKVLDVSELTKTERGAKGFGSSGR